MRGMTTLTVWDIATRFILPPILGGAGGFFTAFVAWDIEKRRSRRLRRQDLVDQWRKELFEDWPAQGIDVFGGSDSRWLTTRPAYRSLLPHLSEAFLGVLHGRTTHVIRGGDDALGKMLASEIARIEAKWDLV